MTVERTVELGFGQVARSAGTHTNLSAVRSDGPVLRVAGDETATVERLVADDAQEPRRYGGQVSFRLADLVPLPAAAAGDEEEGPAARPRVRTTAWTSKASRSSATPKGDERVYLGLRGPVLRGWALVLEARPEADDPSPGELALRPFADGRRYRTHALDLAGLGVRDLCPHGDDLLVLAGPSMDLDGPVHVFRWHDARVADVPQVVRGPQLTRELDLPFGLGTDHAEGIGLLGDPADGRLLVVYDSPAPQRIGALGTVTADVVRLL